MIFVIYYKGKKKVGSGYLCHLTFTLSKFILKNFLFLKMGSYTMVLLSIFLKITLYKSIKKILWHGNIKEKKT